MEEKLRALVAEASLQTSKLSKMHRLIMLRYGYDLSISLISRLLSGQAFRAGSLEMRMKQAGAWQFADRSVHVVELNLTENDYPENDEAQRITIRVGDKSVELPITSSCCDILDALHAVGVGG